MKSLSATLILHMLLYAALPAAAQTGIITGRVTTVHGKTDTAFSVYLKEMNRKTYCSLQGDYSFDRLPAGSFTVIVSAAGWQSRQGTVPVTDGGQATLNFRLTEKSSQLGEVVVTYVGTGNDRAVDIGKSGIKPMDLPQSIAIIGREVLERQQVLRLGEALMNVNGVYLQSTTGGTQEEIAGRGYAYNSSNTFKNGARFNNAAMPEMSSLERVEVLKGSAAILYGQVAAGGIINLVTRKPVFEKGGRVTMRAGSYDLYKPALDVYGPVGKSKRLAYRINGSAEKSRSFRNNVTGERYYLSPAFLLKAGPKLTVLLETDYLQDKRTSDYGVGAIQYKLINIARSTFLGASWSNNQVLQKSATATATYRLNDQWQLQNISGYQYYSGILFGTTRPNAGNFIQPDGTWVRGIQKSGTREDYYVTQTDLTGRFKTGKLGHTLLAGADADAYQTETSAYAYSNPLIQGSNKNVYDTINVFQTGNRQRSDLPAVGATTITHAPVRRFGTYAQDLLSIGKIKILAGLRYSYVKTGGGATYNLISKTTMVSPTSADHAFSPRAGIVYQPSEFISLFSSYSNSFTLNTGTDVYLQPLHPSFIRQYEAGAKTTLLRKLLAVNITAYSIINSNLAQMRLLAADGTPNSNTNIKELAGEVTSNGVEADVVSQPFHGLSLIAGYSYNNTRYTKSNTYVNGSRLRYNPQHTANASVYYTFSNNSRLNGLNASLLAYYVGERVAGRSTRIQVVNDTYALMPVSGYVQLDASAGYAVKKVSVRLKISNVFNALSYYVHDDNSVNPIAPRQLATTVAYRL